MPQLATSNSDDNDALGSIFRFQGTSTALGRDGGNPDRIEWRVENRTNVLGQWSPNDLSGQIGMTALNTGFGYSSSFETDLAVLNWTQGFNNSTAGAAVGRLAFDVYLDAMPFQNIFTWLHKSCIPGKPDDRHNGYWCNWCGRQRVYHRLNMGWRADS